MTMKKAAGANFPEKTRKILKSYEKGNIRRLPENRDKDETGRVILMKLGYSGTKIGADISSGQLFDLRYRAGPFLMETINIPAREMNIQPIPSRYEGTPVGDYLAENSFSPNGIYRHQSMAGDVLDRGQDVVLSTGTNSGKSRIFSAEAFHVVMQDPHARVLVFYPLKSLGDDQYYRWRKMAKDMGFDPNQIGKLDGKVLIGEREKLVENSRILLATPDVFHAWVMSNLKSKRILKFIGNRQLTVLDELDSMHGAFGSNVSYLIRRLEYVQRLITGEDFSGHRYIGASATLPNAQEFFKDLTGREAVVIDETQNGAPQGKKSLSFFAVISKKIEDDVFKFLVQKVKENMDKTGKGNTSGNSGQGIVFIDSRQRVEQMARRVNEHFGSEVAVAQKAGYTGEEQEVIDRRIRSGKARVVISTSSMEAGVDFDFAWGIHVGRPSSKRALLQRMGRVGRHQDSEFYVADYPHAYHEKSEYGAFEKYFMTAPLEEPIIYTNNEFIQIAQALCLKNEVEQLKATDIKTHPDAVKSMTWPRGFVKAQTIAANPQEHLTGERRLLVPPEKQNVHYFHSLRRMSGVVMSISERKKGASKGGYNGYTHYGDIALNQALIEFPPGAIVYHKGKRWRVTGWENEGRNNRILIERYKGESRTRHHMKSFLRITANPENIIKGKVEQGEEGKYSKRRPFSALIRGQSQNIVTSFVEFNGNGQVYPYNFYDDHELRDANLKEGAIDYGPRRTSRISTTGLLLYLPELQFHVSEVSRKALFHLILDEYCAAMRIDRKDVDFCEEGTIWHPEHGYINKGFVYFYDTTPGSLGLVHGLVTDKQHNLMEVLDRVWGGLHDVRNRGLFGASKILMAYLKTLKPVEAEEIFKSRLERVGVPEGYIRVSAPGSIALYNSDSGVSQRIKVCEPTIMMGTPGYMVESINRREVFNRASKQDGGFVTVDKDTFEPIDTSRTKLLNSAPPISTRFVAAAFVHSLDPSNEIAMNVESGELVELGRGGNWIPYVG